MLAWLIAIVAAVTVGGALAIQHTGYSPCELCLKERLPYYAGIPVALLTSLAVRMGQRQPAIAGFGLLILIFIASSALGLYHAGVEWRWWPGPMECSGVVEAPAKVDDFLKQLGSVNVVRCDAAAMHVLGLSLSVWNALISLLLVAIANVGLLRSSTISIGPQGQP